MKFELQKGKGNIKRVHHTKNTTNKTLINNTLNH